MVDWFLVPATAEPLISCGIAGSAEFREREELEIVQVVQFCRCGYGPHARFRTVCSIDFAGGYIEAGRELVARDY